MILPIYTSINRIDKSLLEASQDLGATEAQTIKNVILPLSKPGVISGIIMVFVPSITTFVVSRFFSRGDIRLVGDMIYRDFMNPLRVGYGSALSLIVLIFIFITMFFVNHFSRDKTEVHDGGKLL